MGKDSKMNRKASKGQGTRETLILDYSTVGISGSRTLSPVYFHQDLLENKNIVLKNQEEEGKREKVSSRTGKPQGHPQYQPSDRMFPAFTD